MMDLAEAFQIVIDLARENIIDDPEFTDERIRQEEALKMIEDFAVNQFGDE